MSIQPNKEFKKTKLPRIKGAAIYKKGNRFYHRDTFHCAESAHLEVYGLDGKHLGKADIFTGILIEKTQSKTKKLIK